MDAGGDSLFYPPRKQDSVYSADISGVSTSDLPDIPMVWVSKPMGISKMFKCRFCPHVNMRKTNIQEHEKMHSSRVPQGNNDDNGPIQHYCPDCNYICNNAGVLSSHMKVHQAFFGQVCGVVDHKKSDEEQIEEMKKKVAEYEASIKLKVDDFEIREDGGGFDSKCDYFLHFCDVCPARFLFAKEIDIHSRFHTVNLPFKCESCSYTARQKSHLMAHQKVHGDEYQERTRTLSNKYPVADDFPKPKVAVVLGAPSESGWNWKSESVWVVVKSEKEDADDSKENEEKKKKPLSCDKCPARFFKEVSLQCHQKLHGGPGPYKCKYCDYAVKTQANLIKHEAIHDGQSLTEPKIELPNAGQKGSPQKPIPSPSQEDPEFGSLIFGSTEFVYPTYMKNGRLREKRYKCHKCPSAFEKREQYKIHLSLHGSTQRYKCEKCDYSVKYFANYAQHLRRHELNEMALKDHGSKPIIEDQDEEIPETMSVEKSRKSLKMSVADQQTLMLMQARNISNNLSRDSLNGEVISRCPHCPYANNRKDGVLSHIKCHSVDKKGLYTCKFCDYSVPQLHFLREHSKVHFSGIKYIKPDAYMKCDKLQIVSEPVDSNHNNEKKLIFKDNGRDVKQDRFLPPIKTKNPDLEFMKGRVYINLKTGEEEVEMDDDDEEEGEGTGGPIKENGHRENMEVDGEEEGDFSEGEDNPHVEEGRRDAEGERDDDEGDEEREADERGDEREADEREAEEGDDERNEGLEEVKGGLEEGKESERVGKVGAGTEEEEGEEDEEEGRVGEDEDEERVEGERENEGEEEEERENDGEEEEERDGGERREPSVCTSNENSCDSSPSSFNSCDSSPPSSSSPSPSPSPPPPTLSHQD